MLLVSCQWKSKPEEIKDYETLEKELQKHTDENGWIKMSEISVKEFVAQLKIEKENTHGLNLLSTIGQTNNNWITNSDLVFLISKIESTEKSKCVMRVISSNIPNPKNMTIGNQVISIIDSYRQNQPYPNGLTVCESYDEGKVNEIRTWWTEKKR